MAAILIVEDDPDNRAVLSRAVEIMGYEILTADSAENALSLLAERKDVSLLLCDICLPGMDGIAFNEVVHRRYPSLKVALVTGDADAADNAIRKGVIALLKPYSFTVLTRVIAETLGTP